MLTFCKNCGEQNPYSVKKLTDKEILEEWDWSSGEILATDLLDFAEAIIRKVQEK